MKTFDNTIAAIVQYPNRKIGNLPISFAEYAYLLFPGKLYGNNYIYDKTKHKEILHKLSIIYTGKGAQLIHKAGMAYSLEMASKKDLFVEPQQHYKAIEYSYTKVCNLPLELTYKTIGIGFTSIVFDYAPNKIIKIAFNKFNKFEIDFFKYQKKHNVSAFPYIYSISSNMVVMEKLLTQSIRLTRFKSYISTFVKINYLEEISYRTLNTELNKLPEEFKSFVSQIQKTFQKIFLISSIGDLKIENIGEREASHEIVMFDPIGGYITHYQRIMKHIQQ